MPLIQALGFNLESLYFKALMTLIAYFVIR